MRSAPALVPDKLAGFRGLTRDRSGESLSRMIIFIVALVIFVNAGNILAQESGLGTSDNLEGLWLSQSGEEHWIVQIGPELVATFAVFPPTYIEKFGIVPGDLSLYGILEEDSITGFMPVLLSISDQERCRDELPYTAELELSVSEDQSLLRGRVKRVNVEADCSQEEAGWEEVIWERQAVEAEVIDLNGLWSSTDGSVRRVTQEDTSIEAVFTDLPGEVIDRFSVNLGDTSMEGTIDGRTVRGRANFYFTEGARSQCPEQWSVWTDFELTVARDTNTLQGRLLEQRLQRDCSLIAGHWFPIVLIRARPLAD